MKLVTFELAGRQRIGAMLDDLATIADLQTGSELVRGGAKPHFETMLALIEAGPAALDEARAVVAAIVSGKADPARRRLADVRLLAPVPVPQQMRDFLAFETHYRQARARALKIRAATFPDPAAAERELAESDEFKIPAVWYQQPIYYKGNRFSVVGPDTDVIWPSYCQKLDFELEFGVYIGRKGKNIPRERAGEYIFGYSIFNDISARDAQYREYPGRLGPAKGKDFDTGNILGPWLVTTDEVPDPYKLDMVVRVNGEVWGGGNTGTIHHKFEDMIVHASCEETLHPGEFFGSGTVGNGCGLELDRWLQPNDVVELEVTGLGVLRNRIVKP